MIQSVDSSEFSEVLKNAKNSKEKCVVKINTPFPSPEDWRDQTIYFIMTDRFNNPESVPKSKWDERYDGFQGGTFNGICEKLDYIKLLGFTAIWLTPVFKNCSCDSTYHGYGIQNFLTVDPRFGTEEELQHLVDQAHARGIYIILDIVLNHAGEVFKYDLGNGIDSDQPPLLGSPGKILWRDGGVLPADLQNENYFFRLGNGNAADNNNGDFFTLRKFNTDYCENGKYPVRDVLIKAYQYAIAKFDIDGFRIDTLKYISSDFAHIFGNAIREFAQGIGKKNFFTFGEVYDSEWKIAQYIGRNTENEDGIIGVDAALDFPLFYILPGVVKGSKAPVELARMFSNRKEVQKKLMSSHGDAGKYFVSFIDSHDQDRRFYYPGFEEQLKIAVGALITLQGITCIYYGTEQGLSGSGGMDFVREALWGKPNAFDTTNPIFEAIKSIINVHTAEPAIRYGRLYFREISGDGVNYGISQYPGGIVAYSRILNDEEVLVVINTNTKESWSGYVITDSSLNNDGTELKVLYSNYNQSEPALVKIKYNTTINKLDGSMSTGSVSAAYVNLKPMEIQILKS